MSINSRLQKLERVAADNASETGFTILELGPGWSVEIRAQIAPQVFRNIEKIYGQDDSLGERIVA